MTRNRRTSVRGWEGICIMGAILFMLSCTGRSRPVTAPAVPSQPQPAAPPALTIDLAAKLPKKPMISAVRHDAMGPQAAGNTVRFSSEANVPEGHRLVARVGSIEVGLAPSQAGQFTGAIVLPDLAEGSYPVHAVILAADNTELASADGVPIQVAKPRDACAELQTELSPLRPLFAVNDDKLDARAQGILSIIAQRLKGAGFVSAVTIEGYCDEQGSPEYNMALGKRRAQSAKTYLAALDSVKRDADVVSYGKEKPVDSRSTPEAWEQNRRVEVKVTCSPR